VRLRARCESALAMRTAAAAVPARLTAVLLAAVPAAISSPARETLLQACAPARPPAGAQGAAACSGAAGRPQRHFKRPSWRAARGHPGAAGGRRLRQMAPPSSLELHALSFGQLLCNIVCMASSPPSGAGVATRRAARSRVGFAELREAVEAAATRAAAPEAYLMPRAQFRELLCAGCGEPFRLAWSLAALLRGEVEHGLASGYGAVQLNAGAKGAPQCFIHGEDRLRRMSSRSRSTSGGPAEDGLRRMSSRSRSTSGGAAVAPAAGQRRAG